MTNNKIIVKLRGGLGNQMFQYAVGRHLSQITKAALKLDITSLKNDPKRDYSLDCFNITENFATDEEIKWFKKYQRKPGKIWFLRNRLLADETKYAQERQFHFDQKILQLKQPVYLDGYWQTEKYFKDIEHIIRKEVIVKTPLQGENAEVAEEIVATTSVAMHIRRGDYVTNRETNEYHGTCGLDYYRKAIEIISKKVNNPHFFIFSDDHKWAKDNIVLEYPATYVEHNNADKNYEDLRLMNLCKHQIIANSSFSWWGAWLNPNKEKIVIAPKRWFQTPKMDTRDLLPDSWIRI